MIERSRGGRYTIITILNYDLYQNIERLNERWENDSRTIAETNNNSNKVNNISNIAEEETSAMIKKEVESIEKKDKVRYEHQLLGLELHSQLRAPFSKKGE